MIPVSALSFDITEEVNSEIRNAMDKKLITTNDLADMQGKLDKTIEYYESEIDRLVKENLQLTEDKRHLLEQLKHALGVNTGIGFAN